MATVAHPPKIFTLLEIPRRSRRKNIPDKRGTSAMRTSPCWPLRPLRSWQIFLAPTALPLTLLAFNVGVLSAASNLVLPFVLGWFEEAKKFKAQGDKETAIAHKLQELRAMQPDAIIEQFNNLDVTIRNLPSSSLQQAPELAVLARVIYRDKQAEDFTAAAARLKTENKFRESLQAEESAAKASAKAAFFSSLIDKPTRAGKFKEHFAWVDQTIEERAFRNIYRDAERRPARANTRTLTSIFECRRH